MADSYAIAANDEDRPLAEQILRRWEDLKALRIGWEGTWQEIADYMLPRRDFNVQKWPGELVDRRLLDATGMIDNDRLSAMLFGFLVSPNVPFVRPDVARHKVAKGEMEVSDEEADWLEGVQWSMHGHFMSAKSGFKSAGYESLSEYVAFGTGVFFTGARPGFGAYYQSRPLQSCWISANADDEVDTLYYAFTLPAWRVVQKWPKSAELDCIKKASERRADSKTVRMLYAVEPRQGGRVGAQGRAKPFKACVVVLEEKAVIDESGFDSFPFGVPRFYLKPGEVYGYGPGHVALPDVRMLNAMMESVLRGAELRVDPPIMVPLRMFSRPINRKRSSVNYYQASQLGLQTAEQAVRPLNVAGDVAIGVEMIRELRSQVDFAFFTDWMRLRESGTMTATEVNDRRDLRLRGLSPIVGRAETDFMGRASDRTFEINSAMGFFGEPPASLSGGQIDWGYTGPMALAQLQGEAEAVGIVGAYAAQMAELDPASAKTFDGEAAMRVLANAKGLPPQVLRSRAAIAAMQEQQDQQEQQAQEAATVKEQAQAFKDGAQGVSTLADAMGAGGEAQAA